MSGWLLHLGMGLLGIGYIFAFSRLIRGPNLIDRIAATDVVVLLTVGLILAAAMKYDEPAYIQSAVAISVFGFLGNLVFALVISPASVGRKEEDQDAEPR